MSITTPTSTARPGEPDAPAGRDVFELRGLTKSFPNVRALRDVSIDVRPGETLALMGENGAGKSTLLRILSGEYRPDSGTLAYGGRPLVFNGPKDARGAGVRVIYQEPEIVPGVDVAENIYVGELPRRGPFVDRLRLDRLVRADIRKYGFESVLSPRLMGDQLSPAQRQIVEILRALKSGVRLLALDEPTSSLTDEEVDRLFALIRRLRDEGVAIIYVSHRIREILRLADRVAVLRDGELVALRAASELTEREIVRLMVGRDLQEALRRTPVGSDRVVLEVDHLRSNWHSDVSCSIRAGEVVGFAGLVGAGRTELAKCIFGDFPIDSGTVKIEGRTVTLRRPDGAISAGMGLAPEDRKREGLVLVRSVRENVAMSILRRLSRLRFVIAGREERVVSEYVQRLNVRTPSLDQEVGKLSGGNQQKVVLARWLAAKPKLLILDEPTRGIDVGAKAEIYRLIDDLARAGIAIMLISSELPEILGLSDRILVMQNGRITGELPGDEATEEQVLGLAMVDNVSAAVPTDELETAEVPTA